jgi:hypothetical protein
LVVAPRSAFALVFLAGLTPLGCADHEPPPPPRDAGADTPVIADTGDPDAEACLPLETIDAQTCPASWDEAIAGHLAFCTYERRDRGLGLFDADRSGTACQGFLRYSRYLFDAGPRFCLYDPGTEALVGYYGVGTKFMFREITCGSSPEQFLVKCPLVVTCAHVARGLPACTWPASLDQADATKGECRAARSLLSCRLTAGATALCLSDDPNDVKRCPDNDVAAQTVACDSLCAQGEYAVACGKAGPSTTPSPPPGCKDSRVTPGGVVYSCCPCGS